MCLATKFGNVRYPDGTGAIIGKPEYVVEACDKSLQRLNTDHIDLFYVHRIDPTVPIEDTIGAMAGLIDAGKIRYIGLSEAGAETIKRANAAHPVSAVQTEYSLATRHVEKDIMPVCEELGIGFVAYSPLCRGLISGAIRSLDSLAENDRRRAMPRFQGDNLNHNLAMIDAVTEIASEKGVSTAAVALAWLLAKGEHIVPIPGCSRRKTLSDCLTALNVELGSNDIEKIESVISAEDILGTRYPEKQMSRLGL